MFYIFPTIFLYLHERSKSLRLAGASAYLSEHVQCVRGRGARGARVVGDGEWAENTTDTIIKLLPVTLHIVLYLNQIQLWKNILKKLICVLLKATKDNW